MTVEQQAKEFRQLIREQARTQRQKWWTDRGKQWVIDKIDAKLDALVGRVQGAPNVDPQAKFVSGIERALDSDQDLRNKIAAVAADPEM